MLSSSRSSHRLSSGLALVLVLVLADARVGRAAPTLGFVENFPGTSLQGWDGGALESNPGTGGQGGAGDGYLRFTTPNGAQHNLGVRSIGAEYVGNWTAAGIDRVVLWLNDVGADQPLEMHFSLGGFSNLWQFNGAFNPPENSWGEFVVPLTNPAGWTQIIGFGTFEEALQSVAVVHVRHDAAPFMQVPDPLDGEVGLDRIHLTSSLLDVPSPHPTVPRALQLAPPSPNPSRGDVSLSLETFDSAPVRLEILDASGRIVQRTELAGASPGTRTWTWDGRNAAGRKVAPGYYRVRATGVAGGMSRGLVRTQ